MKSENFNIETISKICKQYNLNTLLPSIAALQEFSSNQYFDLAILGQFKTGKSSFINALIGKDILPTGVVPITAVITRICYAEKEKAIIYFQNQTQKEVEIVQIKEYIVEKNNPENKKNVAFIDIKTPALEKYRYLRIIDTPGVGSIFEHNTKTTENWFDRIGIAFIAMSVERPFSKEESMLIKNVMLHSPEVIILITKCDLLNQEQLNEIKEYFNEQLFKEFKQKFKVAFFSIKSAQNQYLENIFDEIINPKLLLREEENNKIFLHKAKYLVNKCIDYITIQQITISKTSSEKQQLNIKIEEENSYIALIDKELTLYFENTKNINRESIHRNLIKYISPLTDKIIAQFNNDFAEWKGNLYAISRTYEDWAKNILTYEFAEIIKKEYPFVQQLFDESNAHLIFYIKTFKEKLNAKIFELFNITLSKETWQPKVTPLKRPDVSIYWAFDNNIDLLWFLFPMCIFRNTFRKYFIKQLKREIEKNIHRLANDITESFYKEVKQNKVLTIQYFYSEIEAIKKIILQSENETNINDIETTLSYLKSIN